MQFTPLKTLRWACIVALLSPVYGLAQCEASLMVRDLYVESLRMSQAGQWEEAGRRLEALLKTCPDHRKAQTTLATWYLDGGRAAAAQEVLNCINGTLQKSVLVSVINGTYSLSFNS